MHCLSLFLMLLLSAIGFSTLAQADTHTQAANPTAQTSPQAQASPQPQDSPQAIQFSAYLESYYAHARHARQQLPDHIYSHQQLNQAAINLAYLQASLQQERWRANLAIGGGTFMRANYAREPDDLSHLYQANFGIRLSPQHPLWLDIGVMPSHIGLETARGLDNWTLTRSMMADNSPYVETGAKLSYTTPDQRLTVAGLVLNGWQRIQKQRGNSLPAFGHLLSYQVNDRLKVSSSSFVGSDYPDRERRMRYFHHADLQYMLTADWQIQAAWDVGAEQAAKDSNRYDVWHSPLLQTRYQLHPQWAITARWEAFYDPHHVMIRADGEQRLSAQALSSNLDYQVSDGCLWRLEIKHINTDNPLFSQGTQRYRDDTLVSSALIFHF